MTLQLVHSRLSSYLSFSVKAEVLVADGIDIFVENYVVFTTSLDVDASNIHCIGTGT